MMFAINVLPVAISITYKKKAIGMTEQRESSIHWTLHVVSWVPNKHRHMVHGVDCNQVIEWTQTNETPT